METRCCRTAAVTLFVPDSVRSSMVQYASVLQRLFSQTLSAWTPAAEASLGQQRAFRYVSSCPALQLALNGAHWASWKKDTQHRL